MLPSVRAADLTDTSPGPERARWYQPIRILGRQIHRFQASGVRPCRSFRSLLFAPGNHPRRVEKSLGLDADAVILDLEDAVAIAEKEATRSVVVDALAKPAAPGAGLRPGECRRHPVLLGGSSRPWYGRGWTGSCSRSSSRHRTCGPSTGWCRSSSASGGWSPASSTSSRSSRPAGGWRRSPPSAGRERAFAGSRSGPATTPWT